MKHVMAARREMGVRTVFNMLGPLTNPAGANAQVIGVYAASLTDPLARVLAELGTLRAFVVHGADGLDEISNTGESHISEVHEGVVRSSTVRPEDFGMPRAAIRDLQGGDREENARIIRAVLGGETGPRRDIVLMNAAAALVVGNKAQDLKEGVALAAAAIDPSARCGQARRPHRALAPSGHRPPHPGLAGSPPARPHPRGPGGPLDRACDAAVLCGRLVVVSARPAAPISVRVHDDGIVGPAQF